jgi:hypothetical protein
MLVKGITYMLFMGRNSMPPMIIIGSQNGLVEQTINQANLELNIPKQKLLCMVGKSNIC